MTKIEPLSSHELAQALLALPDCPCVINDGCCCVNMITSKPQVIERLPDDSSLRVHLFGIHTWPIVYLGT